MPRSTKAAERTRVRIIETKAGFDFNRVLGTTVIGLLATLITTGILSMVTLYARVGTLTDNVQRIETTLARHLDHAVDRDEYLRRDAQIQKAIDSMATKDDLRQLRETIMELVGEKHVLR